MSAVVALDVGGTGLKGAIVDRAGTLLDSERRPTPRGQGADAVLDAALLLAGDLLARTGRDGDEAGVAPAVPGLVDDSSGVVALAANLAWRDLPLRDIAQARLGVRTLVWHDARAAALAEGVFGAARGATDWLLVAIGTGIGGAVVTGGHVARGIRGAAGELGHMPTVWDGAVEALATVLAGWQDTGAAPEEVAAWAL